MFACIVVCTVSPQLTTAATDAETATTALPVTAMTSQGMCTIKYLLFFSEFSSTDITSMSDLRLQFFDAVGWAAGRSSGL